MSVDLFALLFTSAWYAASYLPRTFKFEPLTAGTLLYLLYTPEHKTVTHFLFNNEVVYWN